MKRTVRTERKYIFCFLIIGALIFGACKKEKEEEEIVFEGITCMNADGVYCDSSNFDETDWKTDDQWPEKVYNLFNHSFYTDYAINGRHTDYPKCTDTLIVFKNSLDDSVGLRIYRPASPNPCSTYINFIYRCNESGTLQLAIVNQDFEFYLRFREKELQTFGSSWNISIGNEFKKGEIYRIYYRFISDSGIEYKGHGDFIKE